MSDSDEVEEDTGINLHVHSEWEMSGTLLLSKSPKV